LSFTAVHLSLSFSAMETSIRDVLLPEVFTEVLRHLGPKGRLTLRACSRELEAAVANSDLHVDGISTGTRGIGISGFRSTPEVKEPDELSLFISGGFRLKRSIDLEGQEELIHL
ncbi:hypothetical protein PMAYCL1PPCAC_27536, partial [Pristionchus mayeri]